MSRPVDIAPEETSFDEADILEYVSGQTELERNALEQHDAYKAHVDKIEEHRKQFQAKKRLNTEAIDAVRKLMNSKSPAKRYAYLRTYDIARRLLNADDQADMFAKHRDKQEEAAIADAAA